MRSVLAFNPQVTVGETKPWIFSVFSTGAIDDTLSSADRRERQIGLIIHKMPSKVNAAAAAAVSAASTELTEMNDMKTGSPKMVTAERQSSDSLQQFNSAENKTMDICEENMQTSKQTLETTPVLSANVRSKFQPQPDIVVNSPQYQNYSTPTINAVPVPGATTILPGQQQDLQCQTQFIPPHQVAYLPSVVSCEENPVAHGEQSYQVHYDFTSQPLQTCADMPFCQFGWQYYSPSVMFPHQPYQDPCQRFNQFQQAGFIPTLRTPYRYPAFQEAPNDPAKGHLSYKSHRQSDPNSSSFACQKGLEYYCNCDCQVQPARPMLMVQKEPEKANRTSIPSTIVESVSSNQTRSARSSSSDFTKRQASTKDLKSRVSDVMQDVSMPSSSIKVIETAGNREWYSRETHLSSDSGWVSDNSSNKEDGELVDEVTSLSPTMNEISTHFQHSLCLENSTSSSTDESYQESQSSCVSSQCPSTSDDNEHQLTPTKKHQQQPRVMKAIPARFVNLLRIAAENAAVQRKRLEGYPLFRQMMLQKRYEDHQQDQVCGSEMQQLEYSVYSQPNQSTSWCFPGGYVQFQYHQNPVSYVQGQYLQGAGTSLQGLYHQGGSGGYTQGQYQQSPGGYMQSNCNQGSESYVQNHYSQGTGTYLQSQYGQGSSGYMCSDQQCGQEYCPTVPAVPVYVIQVDNPDVVNNCTLYSDGRSYTGSNSQAVYEKHPHSNSSYMNPVRIQ